MSQTSGIVITPLRPEQAGDFLRFFDHERGVAFADNPHHGPLRIFLDAGFNVLSEHKDLTVVRKLL
jgi:hypothetical protein